jgi:hypothetical protein
MSASDGARTWQGVFALIVPPGLNVAAPAAWSALAIERVRVDAR